MPKKFRVLAIDDGGIRDIISSSALALALALALAEIETKAGKSICASFDLIYGTSQHRQPHHIQTL